MRNARLIAVAITLSGAFFIASNALLLSGLVHYGNDTALWDLRYRSLASALASQGDLPLWYPVAGNGFPHFNFQWVSWVANPVGVAIALARPYDFFSLAVENVLWRAVGFAGAFAFARQWTGSALGAVAIAATYVGSGVMSWAALSYSALIGQMFAPWVLATGSLAIRASSPATLARAAGTFGLAYGLMVWCAYPGAWLTAPVLSGPVLLGLACAHRRGHARLAAAVVVGAALSLLIVSLIASENASLTLIEGSIVYSRRNPAIKEGLLRGIDMAGLFLGNPSYVPTFASPLLHPLYFGILPPVVVLGAIGLQRRFAVPAAAVAVVVVALALGNLQNWTLWDHPLFRAIPGLKDVAGATDGLVLVLLFFVPLGLAGAWWGVRLPLDTIDKVLLAGSAWVLLVAGDNPVANFLRFNVPPFVLVRYNHLYFWLVTLLVATFAWRRIEQVTGTPTLGDRVPPAVRTWGRRLSAIGLAALVVAALAGMATRDAYGLGAPADGISAMGSPHLAWQGAIVAVGLLTGAVALRGGRLPSARAGRRAWATLAFASTAAFALACLAGILFRRAGVTPPTIPISFAWQLALDLGHVVLIIATIAAAFALATTQAALRTALAAIIVLDVSLAIPRYFSDNDTVGAPQPGWPFPPFSSGHGGDQFMPNGNGDRKADFVRPFSSSFSPPPAVSRLQSDWGPLYDQWVHFPAAWTVGPGIDASVARDSLVDGAPPAACPPEGRVARAAPVGRVTRLLATTVDVAFTADCDRLLVFTDSWAPGWSASIDGAPVPILRVNGAIRGVMVPVGTHALEWRYRPRFLLPLLALLATGLGAAVALIAAPWWSRRLPLRLPSRLERILGIDAAPVAYAEDPGGLPAEPEPPARHDDAFPEASAIARRLVPLLALVGAPVALAVANYDPRLDGPAEPFRLYLLRSVLAGLWAWVAIAGLTGVRGVIGPAVMLVVLLPPLGLQVARHLDPIVRGAPAVASETSNFRSDEWRDRWDVTGRGTALVVTGREGITVRNDSASATAITRQVPAIGPDLWPWWRRPLGSIGSSLEVAWTATIQRSGPYYTVVTLGRLTVQALNGGFLVTAPVPGGDVRGDFIRPDEASGGPATWTLVAHQHGSTLSIDGQRMWEGGSPGNVERVTLGDAASDREHGGTMTIASAAVTPRAHLRAR